MLLSVPTGGHPAPVFHSPIHISLSALAFLTFFRHHFSQENRLLSDISDRAISVSQPSIHPSAHATQPSIHIHPVSPGHLFSLISICPTSTPPSRLICCSSTLSIYHLSSCMQTHTRTRTRTRTRAHTHTRTHARTQDITLAVVLPHCSPRRQITRINLSRLFLSVFIIYFVLELFMFFVLDNSIEPSRAKENHIAYIWSDSSRGLLNELFFVAFAVRVKV